MFNNSVIAIKNIFINETHEIFMTMQSKYQDLPLDEDVRNALKRHT